MPIIAEEPPAHIGSRSNGAVLEELNELRAATPNRWYRICGPMRKSQATNRATAIKNGTTPGSKPKGTFDAKCGSLVHPPDEDTFYVWAMHVDPDADEWDPDAPSRIEERAAAAAARANASSGLTGPLASGRKAADARKGK